VAIGLGQHVLSICQGNVNKGISLVCLRAANTPQEEEKEETWGYTCIACVGAGFVCIVLIKAMQVAFKFVNTFMFKGKE
jgi:hypothetical protein